MFDLTDKVAVVTGGGSGIGRAIATLLAAQGSRVFIFETHEENGQKTAEDIQVLGGKAHFIGCDVTNQQKVLSSFEEVMHASGKLNILINNAGIAQIGQATTTSEEDFDKIVQVNIKGVYNCIHAGLPHMIASGGGSIVNLGSVAAMVGLPDRFGYSLTKAAVHSMTLTVAKDYINDGIRCNAIAPGRVHTPFVDGFLKSTYPGKEKEMFEKLSKTQPIGRMGKPEEMAGLVLYLCSDEASFITGSIYTIDGGFVTLNT